MSDAPGPGRQFSLRHIMLAISVLSMLFALAARGRFGLLLYVVLVPLWVWFSLQVTTTAVVATSRVIDHFDRRS